MKFMCSNFIKYKLSDTRKRRMINIGMLVLYEIMNNRNSKSLVSEVLIISISIKKKIMDGLLMDIHLI